MRRICTLVLLAVVCCALMFVGVVGGDVSMDVVGAVPETGAVSEVEAIPEVGTVPWAGAVALAGDAHTTERATTEHGQETNGAGSKALFVVADGEPSLAIPVENGTNVTLSYVHSVEKTPVLDVYEVDGRTLRMVRMEFDSYGAGLPSTAPVERTDRGTLVTYPNGTFEELYVHPGSVAGHTLVVDGTSYDLVSLADGSTVRLSVVARAGELHPSIVPWWNGNRPLSPSGHEFRPLSPSGYDSFLLSSSGYDSCPLSPPGNDDRAHVPRGNTPSPTESGRSANAIEWNEGGAGPTTGWQTDVIDPAHGRDRS